MKDDKIHILYLDDEENNLNSFKAAFRREFKVHISTQPSEAVQILSQYPIEVVISDQKMPNLSGVEFFELIIPDYPDPVRILMTGFADIEAVIDAINKGRVYQYVNKPWNEQDLLITIRNASEVYRGKMALREKTVQLAKAYDELEKFVYSASHDLRAPLVSILGILKLAKEEKVEGAAAEYFQMIDTTVGKLDLFVQNIINYYQNLKKGPLIANIDFDLLFDEVIGTHRHFDGAESMSFQKEIHVQGEIKLDEIRLKMILNNMISNSIKYRDRTKSSQFIKLSVSQEGTNVIVSCEDNGVGIDEDSQPRIYDMFYRIAEDDLGSGIGLYIVKEAAIKMNGEVDLVSEVGAGSTFTITFPNQL